MPATGDIIDGIHDLDSKSQVAMEDAVKDDHFGARLDKDCKLEHLPVLIKRFLGLHLQVSRNR